MIEQIIILKKLTNKKNYLKNSNKKLLRQYLYLNINDFYICKKKTKTQLKFEV